MVGGDGRSPANQLKVLVSQGKPENFVAVKRPNSYMDVYVFHHECQQSEASSRLSDWSRTAVERRGYFPHSGLQTAEARP